MDIAAPLDSEVTLTDSRPPLIWSPSEPKVVAILSATFVVAGTTILSTRGRGRAKMLEPLRDCGYLPRHAVPSQVRVFLLFLCRAARHNISCNSAERETRSARRIRAPLSFRCCHPMVILRPLLASHYRRPRTQNLRTFCRWQRMPGKSH